MIIEMEVKGRWRQHEAAAMARSFVSRPVRVETDRGLVRVITEEIPISQEQALRDYFENHPHQDIPQAELDAIVLAETRQAELTVRVRAIYDRNPSIPEVWDVIRALAEMNGIDP